LPNAVERALARERLRRRRDALLLELGALVYELHRRGRRAPDLLKGKAGELAALGEDGDDVPEGPAACPSCGAEAEPGQLVCLDCGARLRLGRQPRELVPALAALIAVVVVGAAAFGFALSELTGGSDEPAPAQVGQAAETGAAETAPPAETEAATETEAPAETEPQAETAPGSAQQPAQSALVAWPEGETAHTVVLVTTSDRPAALEVARGAARSGLKAGLLRADDYDLGTGLWIVFAGRYPTRIAASRQAARLGRRYPGAYPQLVRPRSQ
jgi:hypothetical protein